MDPKSFWLGCKITSAEQSNGTPATGCLLQLTGYKLIRTTPVVYDVVTVSLCQANPLAFRRPGFLSAGLFIDYKSIIQPRFIRVMVPTDVLSHPRRFLLR